jgi:hypothetical protein
MPCTVFLLLSVSFANLRAIFCHYFILTSVGIVLTFAILTIAWDFMFPTIIVVIIAILNDGTILTISKDRVKPSPEPDVSNFCT